MLRRLLPGILASIVVVLVGLAGRAAGRPQAALDLVISGQFGGASYAVALQQAEDGAEQPPYVVLDVGPRVVILDAAKPEQPVKVGQSEILPGVVRGLALSDQLAYAYVATGLGGLQVIDVSDPMQPAVIASYDTGGYLEDLAVAGSVVYLASTPKWDGSNWVGAGLQAVDVSNPRQPVLLGGYDTPGYEHGVGAADGWVFVADGDGGLRVIEATNPAAMQEVGCYDTPGYALDVATDGEYAYVADFTAGLRVVDVGDPARPTEVSFVETPGKARGVSVAGGRAYVADGEGGLRVVDVAQPEQPREVGAFAPESDVRGVAAANGMIYLADRKSGLRVVEVKESGALQEVGGYETLGYVSGVALALRNGERVMGDTAGSQVAYVAAGGDIKEVKLTSLATSKLGQVYDLPGHANDVIIAASPTTDEGARIAAYLYVAEGPTLINREWAGGGLRVLEIGEDGRLGETAFIDTPAQATGLTLAGSHLYLADGNGGLQVYGITRPEAPIAIGIQAIPGHVHDLAVQNGRLYIATAGQGVSSGQLRDGSGIEATDRYQTPTFARGLAASGETLYIADAPDAGDPVLAGNRWPASGLHVVSASNPTQLTSLGFFATAGDIRNAAVDGDSSVVFVADGDGGLLVMRSVE